MRAHAYLCECVHEFVYLCVNVCVRKCVCTSVRV